MSKKIILCSDGTGKEGGVGSPTNVFKIYQMINNEVDQIVLYDNGIGTATDNKFYRFIASTFGIGFRSNVAYFYRYLVKQYVPGDKIYLFGFSRGAATVRVLADMLSKIGLLKRECVETLGVVDDIKLYIEAYKISHMYKNASDEKVAEYKKEKCLDNVPIEMIGVWDTVVSLGIPKDTSFSIIGLSHLQDYFFNRHYNQQLDHNVKNAYQALAIDENRRTFRPVLFDENGEDRPQNIEQVWFAGAHANVGGGYRRNELSTYPLMWMINKARLHGLRFYETLVEDEFDKANTTGQIHNPRSGMFRYYRFDPRHISNLSKDKLSGTIKIHKSVIDRIDKCDYYPILPNKFDVVNDRSEVIYTIQEKSEDAKEWKRKVNRFTKIRKVNYHILIETLAVLMFMTWYQFKFGYSETSNSVLFKALIDSVPSFMERLMYFLVYVKPWLGALFVVLIVGTVSVNIILKKLSERVYKIINWHLLYTAKK